MAKYGAFGATLGMGIKQVETATIVGTITGSGDARVITTAAGMAGTPLTTDVAVLITDTPDTVAQKLRVALGGIGAITAMFAVGGSGAEVVYTRLIAAANDGTLNINVNNQTCTGLTPDATSDNTTAGVVSANIGQIASIGGPSLSVDTEDVTTHDSTAAWEEVVATVARTGEMTVEIVYDPNLASHAAGAGLIDYLENRRFGYFSVTFVGGYVWLFDAAVTNFEPDAPHDGALTASVSLKVSGVPVLV